MYQENLMQKLLLENLKFFFENCQPFELKIILPMQEQITIARLILKK